MQQWSTFAMVAGGAAAAVTGLPFVAVSIRIDVIANAGAATPGGADTDVVRHRAVHRNPAFHPQPVCPRPRSRACCTRRHHWRRLAGSSSTRQSRPRPARCHGARGSSILDALAPNAVTSILLVIAGLLLIFGLDAGFDVLVVPVLVALAGGVTSAWLLLTKIPS